VDFAVLCLIFFPPVPRFVVLNNHHGALHCQKRSSLAGLGERD
jgi:hypothetical protein